VAGILTTRRTSRNRTMVIDYADDLRLFKTRAAKAAIGLAVTVWLLAPLDLNDLALNILAYAGVAAIGAIGLNLLVGYTGQVSLGHGFFVAVGGYSVAFFGARLGLPLVAWLPLSALIGAAIGGIVGPFALRLRGNYLVIISLGLLYVGQYVFNSWTSFTGGSAGRTTIGAIPRLDPNTFELFGTVFSRDQGYFWLVWLFVGLIALLARNIVRSRPGRAMQAIRDRELAAEVIGVSLARYKTGAFVWSGAMAAVAGALYASMFRSAQWVDPQLSMLNVSIQYAAVIIIGGVGTVAGSVIGALLIGSLPQLIAWITLSYNLPLVGGDRGGTAGLIQAGSLNNIIYGLLIILFLMFEPHGVMHLWRRAKAWVRAWPFLY
jgi:branched-chain amino acid transport system permease protein